VWLDASYYSAAAGFLVLKASKWVPSTLGVICLQNQDATSCNALQTLTQKQAILRSLLEEVEKRGVPCIFFH
jgi:hypothetical protein